MKIRVAACSFALLLFCMFSPHPSFASDPEKLASDLTQAKSESEIDDLLKARRSELDGAVRKALILRGDQVRDSGDFQKAVLIYETAQRIARLIEDNQGLADALNRMAIVHDSLGNAELTSKYSQEALDLSRQLQYQMGIADALANMASIAETEGRYADAMDTYQKSYAIYESLNDKAGMGACLNGMGIVADDEGNYDKAQDDYSRALALRKEVGDSRQIAVTLNDIAGNYFSQGNYAKAIQYYSDCLKEFESVDDKRHVAAVTFNMGAVYNVWGNYRSSLDYCQRAVKMMEEIGSQKNLNLMLLGIGSLYQELSNYDEALKYDQQGYALSEKTGDKRAMADALCHMGVVYSEEGNYALAASTTKNCVEIRRSVGLKDRLPDALGDLGKIYSRQGNQKLALNYFQQGLAMAQDLGQPQNVATILNMRGASYFLNGDFTRSAEDYSSALAKAEELKDPREIATTLRNLGNLNLARGNLEESRQLFEKSLSLWEDMDSKNEIADALHSLSELYYRQDDFDKSLEFSTRSAELAEKIHNPDVLWQALTTLGKSQQALHLAGEAQESYERSIAVIDTLRLQVAGGEENEQRFFENKLEPYDRMIGLLYEQKKFDEALLVAEREKARVLDDVLQEGKLGINKWMTPEEKQGEEKSIEELVSLNMQIRIESQAKEPDSEVLADLNARLEKARTDYEAFRAALYGAHPELKMQRGKTQPPGKEDFDELVQRQNVFLEYTVTDGDTFLFVIKANPNGHADLHVYRIAINRKDLAGQIEQFRIQLGERNPDFRSAAQSLYNMLLKPAEAELASQNALLLIPDRELWGLPFQALIGSKDAFLLDRFAISYMPSLTVLRDMRQMPKRPAGDSTNTLLAFGNPRISQSEKERAAVVYRGGSLAPLPETESEVNSLRKLFGSASAKIYTGDLATESTWKREAGKFEILHLATHGILNSSSPLYSHVVLSHPAGDTNEDGLLEAWEILQMNLSADLVVLSACETALGRIGAGEGMIGLSWAFFVAGSRATLVSQWKVESQSTTQLMLSFYSYLRKGNSKPEALRLAARDLSLNSHYRHPFYWAGFVVIGDPY